MADPIVSSLCDAECVASLGERVKLPSGLEYVDIQVGSGSSPVAGYQVTVNYVAMNANGRAFDNSVEKGRPYDIRCGCSAQRCRANFALCGSFSRAAAECANVNAPQGCRKSRQPFLWQAAQAASHLHIPAHSHALKQIISCVHQSTQRSHAA